MSDRCTFAEVDVGKLFIAEGAVYRKMEDERAVVLRDRKGRIARYAIIHRFFLNATVTPLADVS